MTLTGTITPSSKLIRALAEWRTDMLNQGELGRSEVSYAVLGFSGFLGLGNDHYYLPWQSLKFDTELSGYVTGITAKALEGAPKYDERSDWNWGDDTAVRGINDYYGVPLP